MRDAFILAFLIAATGLPATAFAWGSKGHRLVNRAAALRLPPEIPRFLRTPASISEIERLGPELDRLKGAGRSADGNENPGHYVDLDDGCSVAGVVLLSALPATRAEYSSALRAAGTDEFKMGFLPYSLLDGWQRIRKDFAWWRVDVVGQTRARNRSDRAWFKADRELRERLTVRDIGVWGHYVGDGSQPLHATIHFNGWGSFPNPANYSTSNTLHQRFEEAFVETHSSLETVLARVPSGAVPGVSVDQRIAEYLEMSCHEVTPLYEFERADAFERGQAEAVAFVNARLAAGATAMRDFIVEAWRTSARESVGYPPVKVEDIEVGRIVPSRQLFDR